MATIVKPTTFSASTTAQSAQVNSNFDTIYNDYNGNVTNANIAAGAAIAASKLNLTTIAQTIAMSGTALNFAKGADIASASTTDIGAASGNCVDVTGTVTITALGTVQSGTVRLVRFTGALILTHNGTSLILPTGANITTAAGDCAVFESLGSGNWVCVSFQRKDGTALTGATVSTALTGSVIQTANTITGAVSSSAVSTPLVDDTIPQITEGYEVMTLAITPNNASNKLKITVVANISNDTQVGQSVSLFQDATANALATATLDLGNTTNMGVCTFVHFMAAGTTSSTTFRVRAGSVGGTITFNGVSGGRKFGGVLASSITIEEIKV